MENVKIEKVSETNEDNMPSKKTRIIIAIVVAITLITIILFCTKSNKKEKTAAGATQYYIEGCTEEFILRFYNLKYPDTFKLKTIEYYKTSYENEGYELWCTEGYFTAENALGMEIKTDYKIYMQFKFSDNKCYALWVIIDDETYFGSEKNLFELYK